MIWKRMKKCIMRVNQILDSKLYNWNEHETMSEIKNDNMYNCVSDLELGFQPQGNKLLDNEKIEKSKNNKKSKKTKKEKKSIKTRK